MVLIILQWNARSLIANGQEFKSYIENLENKPNVICVQETWLLPRLDFVIKGYNAVRMDRTVGKGGGILTFIQKGFQYREVKRGEELEYVTVEIWLREGSMNIINFYNPCRALQIGQLEEMWEEVRGKAVWCGDFNAHSTLWGEREDGNGRVIEEFIEERELVCMNDGLGTRVDIVRGTESAIDLTFVTKDIADRCEWEARRDETVGSDHYPITTQVGVEVGKEQEVREEKWILEKADWERFRQTSKELLLRIDDSLDVENLNSEVSYSIICAAEGAIPKSKPKTLTRIVPWWNEKCRQAVKDRNRAFRLLKRTHNFQSLIEYKQQQAVVRRTVRRAKRDYWREFCSSIGRTTPVERVWGTIKKMKGNGKAYDYPVLIDGERAITDSKEKAEIIAKTLVKVHSTENLSQEEIIRREETLSKFQVDMQAGEGEGVLNMPFTRSELNGALRKLGKTAPGKDQICYSMLKNITEEGQEVILKLFNRVWETGVIPTEWKKAVIVPIKKPGKDPKRPASYRPIALTSHVGKTMERMINDRLSYWVETKGYIESYQSGFRKGRGTMDPVLALEDEIRKAQTNKEAVAAVFLDIEKAYDMLWKEGLLIQLNRLGVKGQMFQWVKAFLSGRSITVRVNGCLSECYPVENGTPQGSIVSPLLFSIMINGMFKEVQNLTGVALFADDGTIWKRGRNIAFLTKKMQQALNIVQDWAVQWGFRISEDKTKCILFTKKRKSAEFKLRLAGNVVERVDSFKYLGLWFDRQLTWGVHVNKMVEKCKRVLNVMRCLCGVDWGASRSALQTVYTGMIRSVFDYGCMVYGSAAKTTLKQLDVVHNQALRICCGAVKTTPIAALQIEMGEMPLHLRRDQLALVYWANLRGHSDSHMTQSVLTHSQEREKEGRSFGWTIERMVAELELNAVDISPTVVYPVIPPWLYEDLNIDLCLLEERQSNEMDSGTVRWYMGEKYAEWLAIYTDASRKEEKVGVAYAIPRVKTVLAKRVSNNLAVYTAELLAIWLALQWVEDNRPRKAVIASDSSSALMSIKNGQSESRQDLICEIMQSGNNLIKAGIEMVFLWVPAHIGVRGNEWADKLAKGALKKECIDMEVKYSKAEIKSIVKAKTCDKWQRLWDAGDTGRQYHAIQNQVGRTRVTTREKKVEDVFSRMRFGHTKLNSTLYKIKKHDDGTCECSDSQETVEHVLIHCPMYHAERRLLIGYLKKEKVIFNFQNVMQMNTGHVGFNHICRFLKSTGLQYRI